MLFDVSRNSQHDESIQPLNDVNMKQYGIIYEYLPANNDLHKVNDGNPNTRCQIC